MLSLSKKSQWIRLILIPALVLGILGTLIVVNVQRTSAAPTLNNGLARTPPMGWNDWNAFGCGVSEQLVEQTADFIVSSGMKADGYQYVNVDDCWLTHSRDANGNLVADPNKFPDGMKAVADYVHSKGLKFGIYEDAGTQTCARYSGSLGHEQQDANLFASWGVDYLKYDWCNIPFSQFPGMSHEQVAQQLYTTMSHALAATGRPIVFSLCNGWDTSVHPSDWAGGVGNLWRISHDIGDNWSSMTSIIDINAPLASAAGPGGWNDPDMLEVGNGGMTTTEYRTHFSMWAEMAAPLLAGTDLRKISAADLQILTNTDVIAVDQDTLGAQGTRIWQNGNGQEIWVKPLANGDRAVALLNRGSIPTTISTTAEQVGMGHASAYVLRDLWAHTTTETTGTISASVPVHGVVMYRVSSGTPDQAPPSTPLSLTGPTTPLTAGQSEQLTATLANNGGLAISNIQLTLQAPDGWQVSPASPINIGAVPPGQSKETSWTVTSAAANGSTPPIAAYQLTATASYVWGDNATPASVQAQQSVYILGSPVQAPYATYASTQAYFGQQGSQLAIMSDGADVFGSTNEYGAIYLKGAATQTSSVVVKVESQQITDAWAKAGIMVRNDITQANSSPGYVILAATPGHGYILQWDSNGDGQLDSNSAPPNQGLGMSSYPSWLMLTRSGTIFTGYYSTDGKTWYPVGSANVPSASATQDVGMFATSHSAGTLGLVNFSDFAITHPASLPTLYEAESSANTIAGGARLASCTDCSGGTKVGYVGSGGTLTFNNVNASAAGTYTLSIYYLSGDPRPAYMSVNGASGTALSFASTGSFNTVGVYTLQVQLNSGSNTIEFYDSSAYAPDFDCITIQ